MAAIGDENIRGFDVPMNDALRVRGIECIRNFNREFEHLANIERMLLNSMLQSLAIQIFHDHEEPAVLLADFVNGADISVIQSGCGSGFALEPFEGLRIRGEFVREKFQSDGTAEHRVLGLVNDTHSPAA